jgi:electron transport complex protein RnfD
MSEEVQNEIKLPNESELLLSSSPHLHAKQDIRRIMLIVLFSLLPTTIAGIYFFGFDALKVIFYCVTFCVLLEMIWCKMAGKPLATVKDGSAALTGLLLALNLSAAIPWWICFIGAILAIWLGKQVFGGLGHNPFNPALVARVGLLIGLPGYMTTWVPTTLMTQTPVTEYSKQFFSPTGLANMAAGKFDAITCATPLGIVGTTEKIVDSANASGTFMDVSSLAACWQYFIGNVGGCIGEVSALALLIGGVILVVTKLIKWQVPVAYIGTVALFTYLINAAWPGVTPMPLFHILTGGLLIGAIFMATDMVTSPMTTLGAIIFGFGCGIITCVIRIWGNYPEGVSFSILFMNALVPLIDRFARTKPFGFKKLIAKGADA